MKVAQQSPEAKYMGPEMGPFKCSHCDEFVAPSKCLKVSGVISPDGCCNLYEPIKFFKSPHFTAEDVHQAMHRPA